MRSKAFALMAAATLALTPVLGACGASQVAPTSQAAAVAAPNLNGRWRQVGHAEGEDGTYAEDKDFALKYPNRYMGNDGTQVGLHGGAYAWNKIPVLPRITECTIDTNDVANGKLKVSIKAEAQTKE